MKKEAKTFALFAVATCWAIILAAGELAARVPAGWEGSWGDQVIARQAHFIDRFFPFDALWYERIAAHGYVWDPSQPELKQDIAFFPLWPLMARLVLACVGSPYAARCVMVGLAACFACFSILAFHRLALRLLPAPTARLATLLFALYPGASFLLLSYPTGLMNLLCILALLALMDGRFWEAAACSGLVTAIGPLGLGTALTVWACAAARASGNAEATVRRAPWRAILWLGGIGLLSVAGLAAFLLWQYAMFGDAFAFIKAQGAWAAPLPWPRRIPRAILQALILPDLWAAARELSHAARVETSVALQASLEKALHLTAEAIALAGLLACRQIAPRPVMLQGAFTMALFIWFHSTSRPGNSTLRLTYCVIGMFFGIAWLLRHRRRLAACVVGTSAFLLAVGAFLTAAGYHVV